MLNVGRVRKLLLGCLIGVAVLVAYGPLEKGASKAVDLTQANPLPLGPSLEIQSMTWMEVRDRIQDGFTRVIVPTGGIEQNGPYVVLGKHDVIAREVSLRAAALLGKTLVAPVVSFVPEGNIDPPSGHMAYPGTISVTNATFEKLMLDIATSFAAHGFKEIVFVADSGDTLPALREMTDRQGVRDVGGARIRFIPEFYNYDEVRTLLKARGFEGPQEPFHEELAFSLQLLALDPSLIRYDERLGIGARTLNGVPLENKESLVALGQEILQFRAERFAAAVRGSLRTSS